jgi:hypothetical protein
MLESEKDLSLEKMKHPIHRLAVAACLLLFVLYLHACSYWRSGGLESFTDDLSAQELAAARNQARKLLLVLDKINDDLNTFKGVGKIRLWNKEYTQIAERVLWVGAEPSSLSIVVLISGHPGPRLSTDGKYLYYLDLQNNKDPFKKIRASDPSLEKILSLPVKSSDIIELLRGRVPLYGYSSAVLLPGLSGNDDVLVLGKKWRGVIEKVYLTGDKKRAWKIEVYKGKGRLRYRAEFKNMLEIQGYRVPVRLDISNDKGDGFSLEIDRYRANVSVSPSVFVLKPPSHIDRQDSD